MAGPCDWPVSYAACASCAALTGLSAPERAKVETMATTYLWMWTQRQFGVCSMKLRPCRSDCSDWSSFWGRGPLPQWSSPGSAPSWPYLRDGQWYNARGCACDSACSCGLNGALNLPGPVVSVTEVLVDGAAVSPAAYRLVGNLLVRADGVAWPRCQDLSQPATAAGTWQVTYGRGVEVPEGGQLAAGVLACELAKALCRDSSCALPQRVQTITRQGVTLAMLDPFTGIEKGNTGIWLVDSWVASVTLPRRASQVYSVDVHRPGYGQLGRA